MGNPRDEGLKSVQEALSRMQNQASLPILNQGTNNAYGVANQALQGQYGRDLGSAMSSAGGQASAYGATNPYAWIQHAKGQVGNNYAGQFGNLATGQAQQLAKNPMEAFMAQLGLLGQQGNIAGQRSQGVMDWLPGLLQGGASVATAKFMK